MSGKTHATSAGGVGSWEITSKLADYATDGVKSYGRASNVRFDAPVVGSLSNPDRKGNWLLAADGEVFRFDDAGRYYNACGDGLAELNGIHPLNMPIVGIISTSDGADYWLAAKNGGPFNFGDAEISGSGASEGMIVASATGPLL